MDTTALARAARVRRGDGEARAFDWDRDGSDGLLRLPYAPAASPVTGARVPRDRATLELPLPAHAVIHLPSTWNTGTRLDQAVPVGETYRAGLSYFGTPWMAYPLVLVDLGTDGWLEVAARGPLEALGPDKGGGGLLEHVTPLRPSAEVARTPDGFRLDFEWHAADALSLRAWPSLEAAVDHHRAWMRRTYGLRSLAERAAAGDLPAWVPDVPVVFTFDLWRPHGEVAHTYAHLRDFARELQRLGVPPGALFYLPGWCAPYDLGYPEYAPAPELGGRAGFREALDALHDAGYRAMVHTISYGADPYRTGFERLAHLAVRAAPHHSRDRLVGPYVGWAGGAPARPLDWQCGREPFTNVRAGARGWLLDTAALPAPAEAVLAVGGFGALGDAVVQVTANGRAFTTPAGWFRDHDAYRFPFRMRFVEGVNTLEVGIFGAPGNTGGSGGPPPDLTGACYELSDAVQYTGAWTGPIAGMRADAPEWQAAYLEHLSPTVEEFGVDAVHVDATFLWRWDEDGFFAAVRRRLPRTVFSCEGVTAAGLRFFALAQNGRVREDDPRGAWASQPSELPWQLSRDFVRLYQHLCAPRGFVPVGTSCNTRPVPAALPDGEADRWAAHLARSQESHVLYTMRVNYRDYGLDEDTRRFLEAHVVRR